MLLQTPDLLVSKEFYIHVRYHDFGNVYAAKTAFQVYIEPGSYEVKPETIGADDQQIDRMFANHELEWSTRRRGSTVLVGLLVWMQDITDNEGESRP